MKNLLPVLGLAALAASCTTNNESMEQNPFMSESTLPHGAFPFDKLKTEHYKEAFVEGIVEHDAEINAIVCNRAMPDFNNTIVALDRSGKLLNRVASIFYNMVECCGTDDMLALSEEIQPMMSEHSLNVSLNEQLFQRVKDVYDRTDKSQLTVAQQRLLQDTYDGYVMSGALLEGEKREQWRALNTKLDSLTLVYGQNVQKATAAWTLQLDPEKDLAGLPSFVSEALKDNNYVLTLLAPSYRPFMTYSSRRDLRETAYRAYMGRCVGGQFDNQDIIRQIAVLRQQKAEMLGYATFADMRQENTMAHTPQAVNGLLNQLLDAYKQPALNDVKEVADFADKYEKEHGNAKGLEGGMQPWDFSYYSELLKNEKYSVSDAQIKPYFSLERVKKGVFGLAERLYGVSFKKIDVPVYHPEVECFEVLDNDGSYLGLLYTDFFPRAIKRPGAWMTEFKGQWMEEANAPEDGSDPTMVDSRPHIQIVMSFSKPIGKEGEEGYVPSLLTYDEANTFLHEFGHSLHGLLTKCQYAGQSGTNVKHDFVELPSQFNENFLREKEFLDTFAADYQTGESIPQELIDKIQNAQNFQAAYACVRQLSFGLLDMSFHQLGAAPSELSTIEPSEINKAYPQLANIEAFETKAMKPTEVLPRAEGALMCTAFTHIFSGGYAAGYYGYKWAEVLDADAFSVFQKEGIFNPETAKRFRHILESGDTVDPAELYRSFKGSDPDIKALMRRDGIIK